MSITVNQDKATIGEQIIGETVNIGTVPVNAGQMQEIRAHLDALWLQVAEAQRRGEIPADIAAQAQHQLAKAAEETKKEQPEKATVRERLQGAKILIESLAAAAGLAPAFAATAEAVQKLLL